MSAWTADLLGFVGILALGGAAWQAGGEVALLAYTGVVFLVCAVVLAWRANQGAK